MMDISGERVKPYQLNRENAGVDEDVTMVPAYEENEQYDDDSMQELFICEHCFMEFSDKATLDEHKDIHGNKCLICNRTFSSSEELEEHDVYEHVHRPCKGAIIAVEKNSGQFQAVYTCKKCFKNLDTRKAFIYHREYLCKWHDNTEDDKVKQNSNENDETVRLVHSPEDVSLNCNGWEDGDDEDDGWIAEGGGKDEGWIAEDVGDQEDEMSPSQVNVSQSAEGNVEVPTAHEEVAVIAPNLTCSFFCQTCHQKFSNIDKMHSHRCLDSVMLEEESGETTETASELESEEGMEQDDDTDLPGNSAPLFSSTSPSQSGSADVAYFDPTILTNSSLLTTALDKAALVKNSEASCGIQDIPDKVFTTGMSAPKSHENPSAIQLVRQDCNWPSSSTQVTEKGLRSQKCNDTFGHERTGCQPVELQSAEKRFKCEDCGRTFSRLYHLKVHMKTHIGEKPFICPECGERFDQTTKLVSHLSQHNGKKPYKCQECGNAFTFSCSLAGHVKLLTEETPNKRQECGKACTNESNQCKKCGNAFMVSCSVAGHMKVHTEKPPHKCQECDKACTDPSSQVMSHREMHSDEYPHKCLECGLVFAHPFELVAHLRTHTGEEPHNSQVEPLNHPQPPISNSVITPQINNPVVQPTPVTNSIFNLTVTFTPPAVTSPVNPPPSVTKPVFNPKPFANPVIPPRPITKPIFTPPPITNPVIAAPPIADPASPAPPITNPVSNPPPLNLVTSPRPITNPVVPRPEIRKPFFNPPSITHPVIAPKSITNPIFTSRSFVSASISPRPITNPVVLPLSITNPFIPPLPITKPVKLPLPVTNPVIPPQEVTNPVIPTPPVTNQVIAPPRITNPVFNPPPINLVMSPPPITNPVVPVSISHAIFAPPPITNPVTTSPPISSPVISPLPLITNPVIPTSVTSSVCAPPSTTKTVVPPPRPSITNPTTPSPTPITNPIFPSPTPITNPISPSQPSVTNLLTPSPPSVTNLLTPSPPSVTKPITLSPPSNTNPIIPSPTPITNPISPSPPPIINPQKPDLADCSSPVSTQSKFIRYGGGYASIDTAATGASPLRTVTTTTVVPPILHNGSILPRLTLRPFTYRRNWLRRAIKSGKSFNPGTSSPQDLFSGVNSLPPCSTASSTERTSGVSTAASAGEESTLITPSSVNDSSRIEVPTAGEEVTVSTPSPTCTFSCHSCHKQFSSFSEMDNHECLDTAMLTEASEDASQIPSQNIVNAEGGMKQEIKQEAGDSDVIHNFPPPFSSASPSPSVSTPLASSESSAMECLSSFNATSDTAVLYTDDIKQEISHAERHSGVSTAASVEEEGTSNTPSPLYDTSIQVPTAGEEVTFSTPSPTCTFSCHSCHKQFSSFSEMDNHHCLDTAMLTEASEDPSRLPSQNIVNAEEGMKQEIKQEAGDTDLIQNYTPFPSTSPSPSVSTLSASTESSAVEYLSSLNAASDTAVLDTKSEPTEHIEQEISHAENNAKLDTPGEDTSSTPSSSLVDVCRERSDSIGSEMSGKASRNSEQVSEDVTTLESTPSSSYMPLAALSAFSSTVSSFWPELSFSNPEPGAPLLLTNSVPSHHDLNGTNSEPTEDTVQEVSHEVSTLLSSLDRRTAECSSLIQTASDSPVLGTTEDTDQEILHTDFNEDMPASKPDGTVTQGGQQHYRSSSVCPLSTENAMKCQEYDIIVGNDQSLCRQENSQTRKTRFQCKDCSKSFSRWFHFEIHRKIHTGEKSFKCPECGKVFTRHCILVQHFRIHTGEKPYKCQVCGKAFNQNGSFVQHRKIHTGEKPYKCQVCGRAFNRKTNLVQHRRIHTGEKPHKCQECGKAFYRRRGLENHMRIHTGEKPYKCQECGNAFKCRRGLESHMRVHTCEKPYKCQQCGKAYNYRRGLKSHMRVHTGEKPYKCQECGKAFSHPRSLENHSRLQCEKSYMHKRQECGEAFTKTTSLIEYMEVHNGEKLHKCQECGKAFTRHFSLVQHFRTHASEKPYKCQECGKAFNYQRGLENHVRLQCEKLYMYKCHECGQAFTKTTSLIEHMEVHNGEKLHKCQECGKAFTRHFSLVQHFRTHTGEKPYKCQVCGKEFNQSSSFAQHRKIHTGEKPHKCQECGKAFNHSSNLAQHRRIHTGEKPHKCQECGKAFYCRRGLEIHMRVHTGEKPYKCQDCGKAFSHPRCVENHSRLQCEKSYMYKCHVCGKAFTKTTSLIEHMEVHNGQKLNNC